LGHSAVYITVAFVWLSFTDDGMMDEKAVDRRDDRLYGYQLAAMLCFLIFADNVLRRIEGSGATAWFVVELVRKSHVPGPEIEFGGLSHLDIELDPDWWKPMTKEEAEAFLEGR